jgi:hypothetical protein
MGRMLATRLAALEHQRETATRAWLQSLSEQECAALIDETYGPGTWDWLGAEVEQMPLEEIERPGALWGRYCRWRETQP